LSKFKVPVKTGLAGPESLIVGVRTLKRALITGPAAAQGIKLNQDGRPVLPTKA